MGDQLVLSSKTIFCGIRSTFLLSCIIHLCYSATNEQFSNCSILYNCGSIRGIGYPFWGGNRPNYCGSQAFLLYCEEGHTTIRIDTMEYLVLGIDQSIPKMTIVRSDLQKSVCGERFYLKNTTLSSFSITTDRTLRKIHIFYGCTPDVISKVQIQSNVICNVTGTASGVFFADEFVSSVEGCKFSVVVPVLLTAYNDLWDGKITLEEALNQGFDVQYNAALSACSACETSGGKCGTDLQYQFTCICPDQSYPMLCPHHGKKGWLKGIIGATVAGIVLSACLIFGCWKYREHLDGSLLPSFKTKTEDDQNIEAIIKQYGSLAPRRYSYSDIKKMTNSFREKLGQGGYGDVYKGYLSDSLPVAVKILKTMKGNGEEFINEVASISRTSHVNVVTLLGFCIDGQKRALIYEFLSNGSLEKYIHEESDTQLGLERLYEIAVGIARGLEYLHRGCKTRILHFDIKPHNILLDEDFCPKISDFGLAKLCAKKESIVSMLGARGTIGYIAPEVFSRNFGGVSYKSDVYSYGMMLLEMIGGRKKPSNSALSRTSDTYFPHWIYHRIMLDEDLKLQDHGMSEEENEITKKMIIVGLWCIQTDPSHRPTMTKVIEMLEGCLKDLDLPPKPFLCSPSRPAGESLVATTVVPSKGTLSSPSSLTDSCTTS